MFGEHSSCTFVDMMLLVPYMHICSPSGLIYIFRSAIMERDVSWGPCWNSVPITDATFTFAREEWTNSVISFCGQRMDLRSLPAAETTAEVKRIKELIHWHEHCWTSDTSVIALDVYIYIYIKTSPVLRSCFPPNLQIELQHWDSLLGNHN